MCCMFFFLEKAPRTGTRTQLVSFNPYELLANSWHHQFLEH